ncbi:MAG TPA: XRE family transcriptional regulator [Cyanobacteria bacterium UBA11372]|nr:XRE family transcriptional regulator [Cyanobacteria bacterium UBA11372]
MGRAGKALKQVLETYDISQYSIAVALGIERTSVYRWVHELRDPTAETVVEILKALEGINPAAAETFIKLYLVNALENNKES